MCYKTKVAYHFIYSMRRGNQSGTDINRWMDKQMNNRLEGLSIFKMYTVYLLFIARILY